MAGTKNPGPEAAALLERLEALGLSDFLRSREPTAVQAAADLNLAELTLPPAVPTDWHSHEFPVYGYLLSGKLSVDYENGENRVFEAGVFIAEAVGLSHRGMALGEEAVELIVFQRMHDRPARTTQPEAAETKLPPEPAIPPEP
jgi:quercetin dioxygenase-like cupin family protein